jgi:hypothetical protein
VSADLLGRILLCELIVGAGIVVLGMLAVVVTVCSVLIKSGKRGRQ